MPPRHEWRGIYTTGSNGSSFAALADGIDMLGLRHEREERRHGERRSEARPTRDRRRSQRRRARLRSLMFTALALVLLIR